MRNMVKFSLAFALVASLFLNVLFGLMLMSRHQSDSDNPHSFTFVWGPDKQRIGNGELRLEMDFKWVGENLSIVARINSKRFRGSNYLGLVFDKNHDGHIFFYSSRDDPYQFFAENWLIDERLILLPDGVLTGPQGSWWPRPSPYHTCTFDNATGYTFNINLPRTELNIVNTKVLVLFMDEWEYDAVYVQFDFE